MQQEPISVLVEKKKKSREETKTESTHTYLTLHDKVEISSTIDCNRYSKA